MGAEAAARLGDEVTHGTGMAAMLAGAVVGAVVGAAILAAAPVSLAVGAVIVGGGVAAGALSMKQLVKGFCSVFKLPEPASGAIMIGSTDTFINGRPAARAGRDLSSPCTGQPLNHPPAPAPVLLVQGSGNVFINGQPVARLKDKLVCGAHIKSGSENVFIGGGTQGTGHAIHDLESWVETGFEYLGIAGLVGAGAIAASAGIGALAIFGAVALGFHQAFEGIGKLGNTLGPGYGDLLQGATGLGLLLAGPRLARRGISSDGEPPPIQPRSHTLSKLLSEKWGTENVDRALVAKRADPKLDKLLTDDEYLSIRAYSSNLYDQINPALRSKSPGEWQVLADHASTGMTKMSENGYGYAGDVSRRATFTEAETNNLFRNGETFTENGFLSTSYREPAFPGNTEFNISSKSGVRIDSISEYPKEAEVLFKPGTRFNVLSRDYDPIRDMCTINMEEVP